MRRGFYGWDAAELPLAALEARAARLQEALRAEGLDGALLYTNIARPAAVSWLTGFTPYWSEGLLFVPPHGAPDFATALSNRVAEWMRSVTPAGSIVCTPQPAVFFGRRLAADGAKRLGVLELDMLPGGQAAALLSAAPGLELVDATALFRSARAPRDAAETALFAHAAGIASGAFEALTPALTASPREAMAALEQFARVHRAEEVFVTIASDLSRDDCFQRVDRAADPGASFALRASLAYKSTWVRHTRCFSKDADTAALFARLDSAFRECLRLSGPAQSLRSQIAAGLARVSGARLTHCSVEACLGSYPLEAAALEGGEPAAGSVVCAKATIGALRWIGQLPVILHARDAG